MRQEKLNKGVINMNAVSSELMTRKQVAALFQVDPQTVIRLEASGSLPAIRLGAGSVRYKRSDVEKFIQASITV
jgi:excisionase family DNA binding protein